MTHWGIVVPTASTNYIHNPVFRYGVDGWSAYSTETATGTRTRGVTYAMKGFHSYAIDKTSAADTGDYGIVDSVAGFADFDSGDVLAISAYVVVEDGARVTLEADITNAGGSETVSVTQDGPYTGRISATGTLTADATAIDVRAYVPDDYAGYFYITGIQLELDQLTTYFDGYTEGCTWAGEYSNSNSTRPVTCRTGGIETDFNDYSFYVTGTVGLGAAEIGNQIDEYSNRAGGYFKRARTPVRFGTLIGEISGASLSDLHAKRAALANLFSPDANGGRTVTIYYSGSGTTVYLDVMLDGGFGTFKRNGFSEEVAIQLLAEQPYWRLGYQESAELNSYQTNTAILHYLSEGEWSAAGTATGSIYCTVHHKGQIYIGGNFGTIDGIANTAYLAVFDGTAFASLGTVAGGAVRAIAFDSNDDMYIGGDFTSVDSVADTAYIAVLSGGSWSDVGGSVINGAVYDLKFRLSLLYIVGNMTDKNRVCYWNGTSVVNFGTNNPSATVHSIDFDADGVCYIGGNFANVGGDADMSYVAQKSGSAFEAMGTGTNGIVYKVLVHTNGKVYIGGNFSTVDGESITDIAFWDGNSWEKGIPDRNLNGTAGVRALHETENRNLYIGSDAGTFGNAGVLLWDGYASRSAANDITAPVTIYAISSGGKYGLIIGSTTSYYGQRNIISNSGTANVTPVIRFKMIDSNTTKHIQIHHFGLDAGIYIENTGIGQYEEVLLNHPEIGQVQSSYRQNAIAIILETSKMSEFVLNPGVNVITASAIGVTPYAITSEFSLYWVPLFWSADGA